MKKKPMHPFFKILIILFMIYSVLFILNETGYYEKSVKNRTIITEQKRIEFEKNIEDGKVVSIVSYLPERQDYSNVLTKSANYLANRLGDIADNNIDGVWNFFKTLFIG